MTPARFDILFLIHKVPRLMRVSGYSEDQAIICQKLGLSRATVSKMVKRLVELGLVTKERRHNNRRTNLITLTEEGIRRIRAALDVVFNGKPLFRAYASLWGRERRSRRTRWQFQFFLARIYDHLFHIADLFQDSSYPVYPLNFEIDH